jgi:phage baseplate assembly protein gpV
MGKLDAFSYSVQMDSARYMDFSQNTDEEFLETDAIRFIAETDLDFDIGDSARYLAETLYIGKKSAEIVKGILCFTYELSTRAGWGFPERRNESITGLSLRGRVLEAVRDKVRVCLDIDAGGEAKSLWEFPYASAYTAEGTGGWYCMPEEGDTVLVYFPTEEERLGCAVNSIRTQDKKTDKTDDPAVKYFRTKDGKELKFSREEIRITCVNDESAVTFIRLDEKGGIEITTSESVSIKSDKDINIEASDSVKVLAADRIRLKCKTSEITIDTKLDLCGKEVRIN